MKFTIKELCNYLEAPVPLQLRDREDEIVKAINARYTTLENGDVFFDINNDCGDLSLINSERCPFIISDREIEDTIKIPIVKIDHALDRYVDLCKLFVDEYPDTVRIAVTGSTGKTSMKETLAAVLGNIASTNKTLSNQNNIYFLSKRLQKVMPEDLRFYVQEACVKVYEKVNLTQKLAIAYQPKVVVMTNIYDNHAEVYGDRETTFRIKSSLVEEMGDTGIALLNMDDDILKNYKPRCKTIFYSLNNSNADIYAENINVTNEGVKFDIHWQGRIIKDVFCHMIGRPNVYNCLVAFAIGSIYGVDDELLTRSIAKFNISYSLRQNHLKIGSYNLFIDCFNASLESIENDLKTMSDLLPEKDGRKVVVVGDVAELGEKAEDIHRRIGSIVAQYKMDRYFCFGRYAEYIYEGAMAEDPNTPVFAFQDRTEMERCIKEYIKSGDLILWKASRETHIELSIDNIFGTDYYAIYPSDYDSEALVRFYPQNQQEKNNSKRYYKMGEPFGGVRGKYVQGVEYEYCNYKNGVKIARYCKNNQAVIIPNNINSKSVRTIGNRAFYKKKLSTVEIPETIVNIASNAFLRCSNLQSINLPNSIRYIDYRAFAICMQLEEITIPSSCLLIRKEAFYQCERLKSIIIEGKETFLEERVFQDSPNVVIKCIKGSFAEVYAKKNAIPYCLINKEDSTESNVFIPVPPEREIVINNIYWEEHEDKSRLNFNIQITDDLPDTLWYEVDSKWKEYVNDDRIDGIVVSLLLFAMRGKFTRIKSEYPISEQLKYQLTNHLIPQIVDFEGEDRVSAITIDAPTTNVFYKKKIIANGTGFSRGIDSFATLYEYGHNSDAPEDYKVNFLNVYNVGAFHGMDQGKRSKYFSRELFIEQAKSTVKFADDFGYNSLVVDSNLALFIRAHFNSVNYGLLRKFQNSATERNIGTTLLFQKLFTRFYYASGHTLKEFDLSLDDSSALWEQYAVQFFSTENIKFYISNRNWTRMEKVKRVAELPEAYDNLQVCLVQSSNCGTCMKCKRTLMNLDVLGEDILNRFAGSFDILKYKNENREEFFDSIWEDAFNDVYASDILRIAIENKSKMIKDPPVEENNTNYTFRFKEEYISVKELPTDFAKEICLLTKGDETNLNVSGIFNDDWVKVKLFNDTIGYVHTDSIKVKNENFMKRKITLKRAIRSIARRMGIR